MINRCTYAANEQAHQLAYFERHFADRTGHRGRGFQLRPEHRLEGLLPAARNAAERVFGALGIQWHPFIGHGRSSQAACVNFLMPLADKPDLLASWVGGLLGIEPPTMLPIEGEAAGPHAHVAFAYTGPGGTDWMGEANGGTPQRGAHATAADAAVAFTGDDGRRELLLIEWKYTEEYGHHRLSEDRVGKRVARYGGKAFAPDGPIRADLGLTVTDFFYKPFYQLLRQQILAWQIERAGAFDRVRVLHLSPAGNCALHVVTAPALQVIDGVAQTDAFAAYRATLVDPAAFLERSIEAAFAPLLHDSRAPWMAALAERYPSLCRVSGGVSAPTTVPALDELGRTRLSRSFFLRDFLHSEIAAVHGLANVPDDPALAIAAGTRLCEEMLEPLQDRFGRLAIRSACRSSAVNRLGNEMQAAGRKGCNCATNEKNYASHIWDRHDASGRMGATACIVVPAFWDAFGEEEGGWRRVAWWIHDHLPYAALEFFPRLWAFNIQWHEAPERRIDSYAAPRGCLTKPGMAGHDGRHEAEWGRLEKAMRN